MPAFSVSESVILKDDIENVYAYIRDFKNWPEWSPWLICDPEAKVTTEPNRYEWSGSIVGVGRMEIVKETPHSQIDFALEFKKPWKSKAEVTMALRKVEGGTELLWAMDSKLPWFMFWLKQLMTKLVSMDYQRGLKMLKDVLEKGRIDSTLDFVGEQEIAGCHFVGVERRCAIDSMEVAMGEDCERLMKWAEGAEAELLDENQKPFTIYDRWDLAKGLVQYRVCYPLTKALETLPEGFIDGERPACRAYVVGHTGAYRHLGNAWSAAMLRARSKVFKQSKTMMPFEKYVSLSNDVGEASTVTLICMPLR